MKPLPHVFLSLGKLTKNSENDAAIIGLQAAPALISQWDSKSPGEIRAGSIPAPGTTETVGLQVSSHQLMTIVAASVDASLPHDDFP